MCLKGGPRCYTHAKVDLEKAIVKTEEARSESVTARADLKDAIKKKASYKGDDKAVMDRLDKKHLNLAHNAKEKHQKYLATDHDYTTKRKDADATSGGIAALEEKRDVLRAKGEKTDYLDHLIHNAKDQYSYNLEQYDKREGTVDARQPSKKATAADISAMSREIVDKEAKVKVLYASILDEGLSEKLDKKINTLNGRIDTLRKQRSHAHKTMEHIRKGYIPDPTKVKAHEDKAKKNREDATESFERSDTDGFMSQWASNTMASHHDMQAELERNGGKAEFNALFDSNGNIVPAKMVEVPDRYNPGRTNTAWAILSDPDDVDSPVESWINTSKSSNPATKEAYLAKKGYTMGKVRAPAYVTERGNNLVNTRSLFVRKDRGFFKDVEVVTTNFYPQLVKEDKQRAIDMDKMHGEQEAYKKQLDKELGK